MQISSISYGYNTSFNAQGTTTLQSGQTMSVEVINNARNQITKIAMKLRNGDNMIQQYERTWYSDGIGYATIMQSGYLKTFFEKLGITDESDRQRINNLFNETYDNEKSTVDRDAAIPKKSASLITRNNLHYTEYHVN